MLRSYHHIISLGLNCEPSYVLEDLYGPLDSYVFSWALVPNVPELVLALDDMAAIFSQGYDIAHGSYDMFRCLHTGIQFHGKSDLRAGAYESALLEAAFAELLSRLAYLQKKLCRALRSGRRVLCVVKNHNRGGSARGFDSAEALHLKRALDQLADGGHVDLLCVDREGCVPPELDPQCARQGIYKRLLAGFAPGERAYFYDIPGWARIFAEFDSVHAPCRGASFAERVQQITQQCESSRAARLRKIDQRVRPSEFCG